MLKSEKRIGDLLKKLNDKNPSVVIAAIDSLRNSDPFPGAIQLLADLYDRSEISIIRDHVRSFLNDLKDHTIRSEVVTEIMRVHQPETIAMLVSSCWQSGLDYSEWASDLVHLFCESDFITALECFTVLEESAHNLLPDKKKELISFLKMKENDNNKIPEKIALHRELISIMNQQFPQN